MEACDESIVDWAQNNEEVLQMVSTEREMMDTLRSRQKRWLGNILRHDSLLKIPLEGRIREKRLWKTKNNVLGLVIEDGGRQYKLWWTKDVGTRQIKIVSVKMGIWAEYYSSVICYQILSHRTFASLSFGHSQIILDKADHWWVASNDSLSTITTNYATAMILFNSKCSKYACAFE